MTDESNHSVMQALSQLRPDQREILSLAFWEELDTDQIALVLGCSKNAAAVRLTRARHTWEAAFQAMPAAGRTEGMADHEGGER